MTFELTVADILEWARTYGGPKFHALICDAPYHMQSIVKRFGKTGSAPAKFGEDGVFQRASAGFMGQKWDGGDIAFKPITWELICQHLYPGAFGAAFASARGWHRMACAIEDAGMIIHPTIFCWVYSSGFPKATNLSKLIDKRAKVKRIDKNIPVTELAKIWEAYRYGLQALKPAAEPIIIFQKPYKGKAVDCITKTGAGALNIDGARIGRDINDRFEYGVSGDEQSHTGDGNTNCYGEFDRVAYQCHSDGRWPANFIVQHTPDCRLVGFADGDGYAINRFTDGAKPFGGGAGHEYESERFSETVPVWECSDGCAAAELDKQNEGASRYFFQSHWMYEVFENILEADAMHYCAKASKSERNSGLDEKNNHPAVKPIALTRYLSTLLLPPVHYAPRRILVPFAGVASEMIGALLAGWDDAIGVELMREYCEIGRKRLAFWAGGELSSHVKIPVESEPVLESVWDW